MRVVGLASFESPRGAREIYIARRLQMLNGRFNKAHEPNNALKGKEEEVPGCFQMLRDQGCDCFDDLDSRLSLDRRPGSNTPAGMGLGSLNALGALLRLASTRSGTTFDNLAFALSIHVARSGLESNRMLALYDRYVYYITQLARLPRNRRMLQSEWRVKGGYVYSSPSPLQPPKLFWLLPPIVSSTGEFGGESYEEPPSWPKRLRDGLLVHRK